FFISAREISDQAREVLEDLGGPLATAEPRSIERGEAETESRDGGPQEERGFGRSRRRRRRRRGGRDRDFRGDDRDAPRDEDGLAAADSDHDDAVPSDAAEEPACERESFDRPRFDEAEGEEPERAWASDSAPEPTRNEGDEPGESDEQGELRANGEPEGDDDG